MDIWAVLLLSVGVAWGLVLGLVGLRLVGFWLGQQREESWEATLRYTSAQQTMLDTVERIRKLKQFLLFCIVVFFSLPVFMFFVAEAVVSKVLGFLSLLLLGIVIVDHAAQLRHEQRLLRRLRDGKLSPGQ